MLSYVYNLVNPLMQTPEEGRIVHMLVTAAFHYVEIFTELLHPQWENKQAH